MSSTSSTLKSKFEICLNNDDLSDCEFIVGKDKCRVKGHKLLFGISSPVFRAMLYDESKTAFTFQIEDVETDEFNGMKQFFYTESVDFTSSLYACSVYLASWKYVIPDLMTMCVKYIKDNISVSEVIDVYEFSRHNNIPGIETICCAVFQDNTREIMESDKFLSADIYTLETILKMDSLRLKSEFEVFKNAEKWVLEEAGRRNIDLQQLGEHFDSITRHIRFLTMSKDQFLEGPFNSDLLTAEEKLLISVKFLGSQKDKWPQKLSAKTEHRLFTDVGGDVENREGLEEEEEEVEGENEEGNNGDNENKDGIVHNQMQDEKTQQSVEKILKIPNKAEKFQFIFTNTAREHHFKFQGLDYIILLNIKKMTTPLRTSIAYISLINEPKIKLHSLEKVIIIWVDNKKYNNTIIENVSCIENYQQIFPYIASKEPHTKSPGKSAIGIHEIRFELTLSIP